MTTWSRFPKKNTCRAEGDDLLNSNFLSSEGAIPFLNAKLVNVGAAPNNMFAMVCSKGITDDCCVLPFLFSPSFLSFLPVCHQVRHSSPSMAGIRSHPRSTRRASRFVSYFNVPKQPGTRVVVTQQNWKPLLDVLHVA